MAVASVKYSMLVWQGVWSSTATPGTGQPGTSGVDYAFINKSAIDVYVDQNKVSSAQWANLKAA